MSRSRHGEGDPLRPSDSAAAGHGGLHRPGYGAADANDKDQDSYTNPEGQTPAPDSAVGGPVDPDAAENLGAEFPLRGDQLEDAIEAAKAEAEQWRDKALRAQADFENARKRLEARHADEVRRAAERVVSELLPVMDDLERAADHVAEVAPDLAEGIVAVQRKLLGVMQKEGVAQIDPMGQPFNPELHQAVQMHEDEELPDHTVTSVFQKGYEMHGRCLRPAMVVVCTGGRAKE